MSILVDECVTTSPTEMKSGGFNHRRVKIRRNTNVRNEFTILEEIGRGKFGKVMKCYRRREETESMNGSMFQFFAAKFIEVGTKEERRNVEREIEIMNSLKNEKLLKLFDAFDDGMGEMCLITEYIAAGELFDRVLEEEFILTEKACACFMKQIVEGLSFIHRQGVIHLDLKPENILCLTKTGNNIKIIDFGLARKFEPMKKLQVLFGTPEFVAPEVVNFDPIGYSTDVWAVGVICYVLVSGLSPFMGDTDLETMANVTISQYDYEDEAFNQISKQAKDFIDKVLVKCKEKRLTAEQCLKHPWLSQVNANESTYHTGEGASIHQRSTTTNTLTARISSSLHSLDEMNFTNLNKPLSSTKTNLFNHKQHLASEQHDYIFDRPSKTIAHLTSDIANDIAPGNVSYSSSLLTMPNSRNDVSHMNGKENVIPFSSSSNSALSMMSEIDCEKDSATNKIGQEFKKVDDSIDPSQNNSNVITLDQVKKKAEELFVRKNSAPSDAAVTQVKNGEEQPTFSVGFKKSENSFRSNMKSHSSDTNNNVECSNGHFEDARVEFDNNDFLCDKDFNGNVMLSIKTDNRKDAQEAMEVLEKTMIELVKDVNRLPDNSFLKNPAQPSLNSSRTEFCKNSSPDRNVPKNDVNGKVDTCYKFDALEPDSGRNKQSLGHHSREGPQNRTPIHSNRYYIHPNSNIGLIGQTRSRFASTFDDSEQYKAGELNTFHSDKKQRGNLSNTSRSRSNSVVGQKYMESVLKQSTPVLNSPTSFLRSSPAYSSARIPDQDNRKHISRNEESTELSVAESSNHHKSTERRRSSLRRRSPSPVQTGAVNRVRSRFELQPRNDSQVRRSKVDSTTGTRISSPSQSRSITSYVDLNTTAPASSSPNGIRSSVPLRMPYKSNITDHNNKGESASSRTIESSRKLSNLIPNKTPSLSRAETPKRCPEKQSVESTINRNSPSLYGLNNSRITNSSHMSSSHHHSHHQLAAITAAAIYLTQAAAVSGRHSPAVVSPSQPPPSSSTSNYIRHRTLSGSAYISTGRAPPSIVSASQQNGISKIAPLTLGTQHW